MSQASMKSDYDVDAEDFVKGQEENGTKPTGRAARKLSLAMSEEGEAGIFLETGCSHIFLNAKDAKEFIDGVSAALAALKAKAH